MRFMIWPLVGAWISDLVVIGASEFGHKEDDTNGDNSSDGSFNDAGCTSCNPSGEFDVKSGMPRWKISEPWLNIVIKDIPLTYRPARGPYLKFRLRYQQRAEINLLAGESFWVYKTHLGHGWGSGWLSKAKFDTVSGATATVHMPGGRRLVFDFASGSLVSYRHYRNNNWVQVIKDGSGNVIQIIVYRPRGTKLVYERLYGTGYFLLSYRYDRHGYGLFYKYDASDRLEYVEDALGNRTYLTYGDVNRPQLVTQIAAPGSRTATLGYDATYRNLTSITDAAGLVTTFVYDSNGWPTSKATPYGTTAFASTFSSIGRQVVITDPDGTTRQAYAMFYDNGTAVPSTFSSSQLPQNLPFNTIETQNRQLRNTFYWDRRQWAALGNPANPDFSTFTWSEFRRARIRHWLLSPFNTMDTLGHAQAPSPDGTTEGQVTFYDYDGKNPSNLAYRGTQVLPAVISRRLPDLTTWWRWSQRNSLGKPTVILSTYTLSDGSVGSRIIEDRRYEIDDIRLKEIRDRNGNIVKSYTYDATWSRKVKTKTAYANSTTYYTTTYNYDPAIARLTSEVSPAGLTSTYSYGADGFPSSIVDSIGGTPLRTNSYTWLNSTLRTHTDPRGLTRTYTYDGLNRLTRIDYSTGVSDSYQEFRYTDGGAPGGTKRLQVTWHRDRLGKITQYAYNGLGQLTTMTDPLGRQTVYSYCNCGALGSITQAYGTPVAQTTTFSYDQAGHRISIVYADNTSISFGYNLLGQLTSQSDNLSSRTIYYNNQGLVTHVSNSFGTEQSTVYDIDDQPIKVTDANGVTFDQGFDWLGRMLARTNIADSGKEFFGYSSIGLTHYTNQLNKVTVYVYDAAGRTINENNANQEVLEFTYSPADDLRTFKDGKNQVTTWNHDEYGRVTNKVDQAGVEILRYTYDVNNRMTTRWSKAKGTTTYTYDDVGNRTLVDYPTGTIDITFQYDALNHVTSMVDASGTTIYTYTPAGNLLTEDGPMSSDTVTYGYHTGAARLRISLTLQQPTGNWSQTYAYDAARRLQTLTSPAGTFTYTYKGPGNLWTNLALPNTSAITNAYDNAARLTGTYLKHSNGSILNKHEYLYSVGHQRIRHKRSDDSYYTNTYDNIGQLKVASAYNSGDLPIASENRGYLYDAAWNLNKRTNNTTEHTFAVNVKNELTSEPGFTDQYDSNGNLTGRFDGGYNVAYSYTYDAENQLTSVAYQSSLMPDTSWWKTEFVYDGRGRLRKRAEYTWQFGGWYPGTTYYYVCDGMRVIQERIGTTPQVAYTRGNDLSGSFEGAGGIGGLLARSHGYSGGNFSTHNFYHADGGGNVTYMVNSSQSMVASYRYDPYGRSISQSGTLWSANVYRFSSKPVHVESGMYYYGYRFYDPNLQRWLTRDPISERGGANLFQFALNDPVNLLDYLGMAAASANACGKDEQKCLSCVTYAESRGTSDACQQAVASAVRNRAKNDNKKVCDVVAERGQFDSYNNKNYTECCEDKCQNIPNGPQNKTERDNAFKNSKLDGTDTSGGAEYFHDTSIKTPPWIERRIRDGRMSEVKVKDCTKFRFYKVNRR